ncbi:MAG TPA: thymidine phosphorylase [Chthonomonadales bacterium]|nr:thymidine phosphorylase [Chthonomonadales bacterium]
MKPVEIIARKRDGCELAADEIEFIARGAATGEIPDYQLSAWLMAVTLRGMNLRETADLTLGMRDSGRRIQPAFPGPSLDKHSTGGVGDKASLVVVPILAACGAYVLKMSGRALGFSGGTIDKLESIPGFRTEISSEDAIRQTRAVGAAFTAQSAELAPADRALYALRDVTATVECIPLIASSILSKKLAAGARHIVLDVKVGRGAFMKDCDLADQLANTMTQIGRMAGVPTRALLTDMNSPLGYTVGNALEVREAIELLQQAHDRDRIFEDLCLQITAEGLALCGLANSVEAGRIRAEGALRSGAAAEKLEEIVAAQGGPRSLRNTAASLPRAQRKCVVVSDRCGILAGWDAGQIGRLAAEMGAGRFSKADRIDHGVGVEFHAPTGVQIGAGQPLATLHISASQAIREDELAKALMGAAGLEESDEGFERETLVRKVIH